MLFTFEQLDLFSNIIKQSEHNENSVSTFAKQDLYLAIHYILEKKPNLRTTSELKYLIMMTKNQKFIKEIIFQQDGQIVVYEICKKYQLKVLKKGEYIYKQGEPKNCFTMLLSGEAKIFQDINSQDQLKQSQPNYLSYGHIVEIPQQINYMKRSSKEGDINIKLQNKSEEVYQNSLICESECSYLFLQKDHLDKIIQDFKQRIRFFDELSQMNLFKGWNKNQIRMIQECFCEKQYSINNVVYRDGEESNYLYLVKEGEFVLQKVIEVVDEVKEAEKKEIQSMIHNIQQQKKKRYLLKNQDSHLTAIEKQLKSINSLDTPTETVFEDQIRKKRIKKGELKKIKIISQGESFGAEEFLTVLIDPEQRQSFSSNLIQKRQLTASCSSVTGVLYAIHVKDIFQKIARIEELLPILLKSLKQKIISSENQVNLIKKQKQMVPIEINIAKNLCLNTEEQEEQIKEQDKNILRNYEYNEFKIERRIVYPDEKNKIDQSDYKQKPRKSEKMLLLSPIVNQKSKKKEYHNICDIVAKIEKQEMNKLEKHPKEQIEQQYQRVSKKKSNTVVILTSEFSSELQKAEKSNLKNDNSFKNLKQIISDPQINSFLPKSKHSLINLETNSSLAHLQIDEDINRSNSDQLMAFGKKISQNIQQGSNEDLTPVKSPISSQQRIFSLDKFPQRQFRKSNNQIGYKFEKQQQQQSISSILKATQSPQELLSPKGNSSIHSSQNHESVFLSHNALKKKFGQVQKMDSFNSNSTSSPKSVNPQFIIRTETQDYQGGHVIDSPKTVSSLFSPKSLSQLEQNDRSKFFYYNKPNKTINKFNNENNSARVCQTQTNFNSFNKFGSQSLVFQQSISKNKLNQENQQNYNILEDNKLSNSNNKEMLQSSHVFLPTQKAELQKTQNQQINTFQNHRKLSSPNLIAKSSFLPLKYHASKISSSTTKLNFIPKILKNHTKDNLYNEFQSFCLRVKSQKKQTEN